MNSKVLKISMIREAICSPEINIWNIFDNEHPPFIHGKRKNGDGMDPSFVLFEKENFNVTLDTQRLPFFSFIKRQSIMFHYADIESNTVYQYSTFHGILIAQVYSAELETDTKKNNSELKTIFKINIAFHLNGWRRLLSPLIKWYSAKWIGATWEEDLVMKERRHKFINLGFQDMKGVPKEIVKRSGVRQPLNLPLPKADEYSLTHELSYKNIRKNYFDI